jgi:hypothetical protein
MAGERCSKCQEITSESLISNTNSNKDIQHHTFSVLEQSVSQGCDVCCLLRRYVIHNTKDLMELIDDPRRIQIPACYDPTPKYLPGTFGVGSFPSWTMRPPNGSFVSLEFDNYSGKDQLQGKSKRARRKILRKYDNPTLFITALY